MSASSVLANLDTDKYNVIQVGITREGRWLTGESALEAFSNGEVSSLKPVVFLPEPGNPMLYVNEQNHLHPYASLDIVFPVMHGSYCEDGTLQGFLEMADIAYVGAGVTGSAVGMDKVIMKRIFLQAGILTAKFITLLKPEKYILKLIYKCAYNLSQ